MAMTRKLLIKLIAKDSGLSQRKTSELLSSLLKIIISAIGSEDYVLLRNFGKFQIKTRKARRVRHPITGKYIRIDKRKVVVFKPSTRLNSLLNEDFLDPVFIESNRMRLQKLYEIVEADSILLDKKELINANLKGADLSEASLSMLNFARADLSKADLSGANFYGSNFERAVLDGAVIMWTNLEQANLCSASLQGADLRWANLAGADLSRANLKFANLEGANLYGAKLAETKLHGAKLANTDLDHAQLKSAKLDKKKLKLREYFSKFESE